MFVKFLLNWPTRNLFGCQWWSSSELLYLRVSSALIPYFESYVLMSNSYPHATNMGCVESEPASIHYSYNPVCPCLESRVCQCIHVAQFLYMSVVMFSILNLVCLIYFTAVGDPLYPGFKECLLIHTNKYYLLGLWLVVIVWDTCKHIQTCPVSPLWQKGSDVDTHTGT